MRVVKASRIGSVARAKGERFPAKSNVFRVVLISRRDVGVKAILKDIYDKVKTLELELNDTHKAMANGPNASLSVSRDRLEEPARKPTPQTDTSAWLVLIAKHKE